MGRVVPGGRTVALQRVDQTAHKGDDNQRHQDGAENLAQPVGELLRPQCDEQGGGEEHQGVDQLIHPDGGVRSHEGRDGHFKRGGGRPGDGQAGADGQIGHNGEHPGKGGMHTAAQGPSMAGQVWVPAWAAILGGKIRLPAPKNMENRVKPTRSRSLPSSRLSFSLTVVSFPAI